MSATLVLDRVDAQMSSAFKAAAALGSRAPSTTEITVTVDVVVDGLC